MFTRETADWLNRIGLVFGFLAFWFAAPEFIGEARLRKWEQALSKSILKLPIAANAALLVVFFGSAGLYMFRLMSSGNLATISSAELLLMGVVSSTALTLQALEPWLKTAVARLASDDDARQRSPFLGGALFTLSFVLQLIATFQGSSPRP